MCLTINNVCVDKFHTSRFNISAIKHLHQWKLILSESVWFINRSDQKKKSDSIKHQLQQPSQLKKDYFLFYTAMVQINATR